MGNPKRKIKNKSMKRKITIPFLIILILIPVISLGAMNIFMRRYIYNGIQEQLYHTVNTTRVIIKKELSEIIYETDAEKIEKSIDNLNRVLMASTTTLNTQLMLFDHNGDVIYPSNYEHSFMTPEIISKLQLELAEFNIREMFEIRTDENHVGVMGYRLTELPISNIPYIVFVSSMDVADPLFATLNTILITVMLAGTFIGALLASKIAGRVSKPLHELTIASRDISERKEYNHKAQTDISEIVHLNDSISEMSKKLNIYHNAQKSFLQNASHEIKTPLMSIQGYAEGIEKGMLKDSEKAAKIIKEESIRLNEIINDLLTISRIENLNYSPEFKTGEINGIVKEYVKKASGMAIKEKKSIKFDPSPEDIDIRYNETLLSRCIINIVGNAVRYARECVEVTVKKQKEFAVIEIRDDGEGINPEDVEHIFERFYKGKGGQQGLGLAIAKSAATAMGGDILAENTDSGALFKIFIPVHTNK